MCAIRATSVSVASGVKACPGRHDPGKVRAPTPRVLCGVQPRAHPSVKIGIPATRVCSNARCVAAKRDSALPAQRRRRLPMEPPISRLRAASATTETGP
jgi:hypothetical protein